MYLVGASEKNVFQLQANLRDEINAPMSKDYIAFDIRTKNAVLRAVLIGSVIAVGTESAAQRHIVGGGCAMTRSLLNPKSSNSYGGGQMPISKAI